MAEGHPKIGIIAGGGQFPMLLAGELKNRGFSAVGVAHNGETEAAFSGLTEETIWIELGQIEQLIHFFKQNRVTRAMMAGSINKNRLFDNPSPDKTAADIISSLSVFHDDSILRAVADLLHNQGIEIISACKFLPELTAPAGYLTARHLSEEEAADVDFGWKMAKALGNLDIGQCVVVRKKTVLAVEAIEGTDKAILRGGLLAKERAVVVKVCKPTQDMRFDLPSVGLETIKTMSRVKAGVLAIESGKTMIFDRAKMVDLANRLEISIIALNKETIT